MTVEQAREKIEVLQGALKEISSQSVIGRKCRKMIKDDIAKLEMLIFKAEAPEIYENHKQALKDYVESSYYLVEKDHKK